MIVAKAVNMAKEDGYPHCGSCGKHELSDRPDWGKRISVFGEGRPCRGNAAEHGIKVLAQIPIDPAIAQMVGWVTVEYLEMPWFDEAVKAVEVL